jgi:hypothetical protein
MPAANNTSDLLARLEALEKKVPILEAINEIQDVFNRYGFSADSGNARGWSEVWAENGVYELGGKPFIQGREAFFNAIEDPTGPHKVDIENLGSLHVTGSAMIHTDGDDTAWAEGWTCVLARTDETNRNYGIYTLKYNHWDLQRNKDGRWEIVRRNALPVAPRSAYKIYRNWVRKAGLPDLPKL